VLGIDLVRMQLAIAAGAPLGLQQSDVAARGWAIEARINAEDPANAYLPAIGTITRFDTPSGPGVRLDAGVRAGSNVSIYYDSMLAKLIAYGPDRTSAVERLTAALENFRIEGVRTNVPLLLRIARDVTFRAGYTTTAFLTEHANFLRSDPTGEPEEAFVLAIAAVLTDPRAWRSAHVGIPVRLAGSVRTIAVEGSRAPENATWIVRGDIAGAMTIEATGDRIVVRTEENRCAGRAAVNARGVDVTYDGREYYLPFAPPPSLETAGAVRGGSLGAIVAPMPGKIVKVEVSAGDSVLERDLLVVLEAMKMEHRIEATRDGVVKSVAVVPGALVSGGATLVEMEA
jgi:acetyl/propionyl-CoA carboxylase alpha subunit